MHFIKKSLTEIIRDLILSKREDEWWDFKEKYHDNNVELVFDILCMANNRHRGDSYIIFGVSNKFEIVGIGEEDKGKNQQQIVDTLKSVPFAGGNRPKVEIKTIIIEKKRIDVLIVKDSFNTPYYLEKDYKGKKNTGSTGESKEIKIRKFHIYTRVVDSNTPIDTQADLGDIEYLWRKRFGINLTIKERLDLLLSQFDRWDVDWDNRGFAYHIDYPEFQIFKIGSMEKERSPIAAFYLDSEMHFSKLQIKYHNTIIYQTELWAFDGFRTYLPKAECKYQEFENSGFLYYRYYMLDSFEGKLLKIFTFGKCNISSRGINSNQMLIFNNKEELDDFNSYVENHYNDYIDDDILDKFIFTGNINHADFNNGDFTTYHVAKAALLYDDWKLKKGE